MRVEESIEIERPVQTVWAMVSDLRNDPRWCRKVKSVEADGDGRWTVIHKPVPLRPAVPLAVVEVERRGPDGLTLRQEDGASVFHVEYTLEPTAAGTRFSQVSDFEWKKLPRMLHRTFARGVRNDVRRQLHALKETLESD